MSFPFPKGNEILTGEEASRAHPEDVGEPAGLSLQTHQNFVGLGSRSLRDPCLGGYKSKDF